MLLPPRNKEWPQVGGAQKPSWENYVPSDKSFVENGRKESKMQGRRDGDRKEEYHLTDRLTGRSLRKELRRPS